MKCNYEIPIPQGGITNNKSIPSFQAGTKKEFYQMNNYENICRIEKRVAVLSANEKGFTKEVNYVSWYGNDAKLDIRDWRPDRTS